MDEALTRMAGRLRDADSFAQVATVVIDVVGQQPGLIAVAVEAHDRDGPCEWFGSPGFAAPAGDLHGAAVAALRARGAGVIEARADGDRTGWVAPIVGCGEVIGAVRVRVEPGTDVAGWLVAVCTLVSVRVAQLGGTCDDAIGARALTARQYEVSVLVSRGSTNAEIARLLSISPDAVKKHVSRALLALEVSNRTELAAIAGRWRCTAPAVALPVIHTELRARRSPAPRSRAA